jgi:hypothetical protein
MITTALPYKSGNQLSTKSITIWRIIQTAVWFAGLTIFLSLIFYPSVGLLIFWNILIPVAPALLVVATGVWRNVCPLATTNLLPRHFNLSKRKTMSVTQQTKLQLIAIIALYTIVPLRHAIFDTNGMATAILLFSAVVTGITMGFIYDWKSGWCSSLCPIHPVEKLYGGNTLFSLPNAHCDQCVNCSIPCPDSTPNIHPAIAKKTTYQRISGLLTIGGLPGFIWGWFHAPDYSGTINFSNLFEAYKMPFIGFAATLILYLILKNYLKGKNERILINCFAAAGVSCYYWYRIPALFGFGKFADDGLLISLKNVLPEWSMTLIILLTTIFFFGWLILRNTNQKSWVLRPKYAVKQNQINS